MVCLTSVVPPQPVKQVSASGAVVYHLAATTKYDDLARCKITLGVRGQNETPNILGCLGSMQGIISRASKNEVKMSAVAPSERPVRL